MIVSEIPGTKSIDIFTPESIKMLWELTMDISNRLAKLEKHNAGYKQALLDIERFMVDEGIILDPKE